VDLIIAQALNGFVYGTLLFLLAAGLSLIFGLMGVVNLAHGSFFMLGAFFAVTAVKLTGNFWLAMLLAPIPVTLIAILVERFFLRPLYARDRLDQVLLTFGFSFILTDITEWAWGKEMLAIQEPGLLEDSIEFLGGIFPLYRLALVGFGVWRKVSGPAPESGAEELAHVDWESWARRGAALCREVYGRAYHKLLVNLRALHPALEDLVLVDAYGKVIGRPGLDLKRRELTTVAATAVLGTAQQLHSHLRGALNTGATPEEIEAVLGLVDGDLDPELRRTAREQWEDVRGRNL